MIISVIGSGGKTTYIRELKDKYVSMNLLNEENDILRLTDKGIDVSNIVLADFLL